MRVFVSKFSRVAVTGKHQGIFTVDFDWLEEDACCDAYPQFNGDFDEPAIEAFCDCGGCEGYFRISLKEVPEGSEEDHDLR